MSDQDQTVINEEIQENGATQASAPVDQAAESGGEAHGMSERLATLEKERDEYLDQWRRSAAEFQNFRKREERLRSERERSANVRLLRKLLPVLDDLQRAAKHVPENISDNEWVGGMLAIERKVWAILEQEGVSAIEAVPGSEFNPNLHEALISQASETFESGQVIQQLEPGYRHNDSVLRPARVSVAQ